QETSLADRAALHLKPRLAPTWGAKSVLLMTRMSEFGVDAHLDIHLVRDRECGAQHRRRGAPVLVAFQTDRAGLDLFDQSGCAVPVPLAENTDIDGPALESAQHHGVMLFSRGHKGLHCLPALNGATDTLGNFPDCLTAGGRPPCDVVFNASESS